MSSIPTNLSRVSGQLKTNIFLSNLNRTNADILNTQNQLATGLRVNRPSDDPSVIGGIMSINKKLNEYEQNIFNYEQANSIIGNTDAAISDVMNVMREAYTLGQEQIQAAPDLRTPDSVLGLIDELRTIVNREYQDVYLFAGSMSGEPPFVEELGGMRYVGSTNDLTTDLGWLTNLGVNTNGCDALGGLSARVESLVDLDPIATGSTHFSDVNGTRNTGISPGVIVVNVDGTDVNVDLTDAETLDDVVLRVNAAIETILAPGVGVLSVTDEGLSLTVTNGSTIAISDVGMGATAIDLGIDMTIAGPGTVDGADIDPRLTIFTKLSELGVAVDLAPGHGLSITNGGITRNVDLSGVGSVEDMINAVSATGIGVRVEINQSQTGFNFINELSGSEMSIGEVGGGTTAGDLGIRSFDTTTRLSEFNHGRGIRTIDGETDLVIRLHDGTQVDVNLDGSVTVQDVIDAINAAGGGNVGASLVADGNGIELTDSTVGGDPFVVESSSMGFAAGDLGIDKAVGAAENTIVGDDKATVRTESVFTHLKMLYEGLEMGGDVQASALVINEALAGIKEDMDRLTSVQMGARSLRVASAIELTQEQQLTAQDLLSGMQDVDYAEAITQFTALEQQLEANLLMGQMLQQQTLLDFLR